MGIFDEEYLGKREVEKDTKRETESLMVCALESRKLMFPVERIARVSLHVFFSYLALFRTHEYFRGLAEGMQSQTLKLLSSFWMLSHNWKVVGKKATLEYHSTSSQATIPVFLLVITVCHSFYSPALYLLEHKCVW